MAKHSKAAKPAATHVALLRGINVGGKNRLPMKELAALFHDAGCDEVRTYIQSGNVVFEAGAALAGRVPGLVEAAIRDRFGLQVPVLTRTASELRRVAGGNPFLEAGAEPRSLHVAFLADKPSRACVAALDPSRSPPDQLSVRGREVYLFLPNGMGRTRFATQYLDATLATVSTGRNWRTVLALLELARGRGPRK